MIKQPRWKTVEYSKGQINRAGETIRNKDASKEDKKIAEIIVDNWRAAHAFPLHVIYVHLRRMAKGHNGYIVAERLKRLSSIKKKLGNEQGMNLSRMQDLGGCRVIVPSIADVYKCAEEYEHSRKRHILKKNDHTDYIKMPKKSGYRSLHRVYKYRSDDKDSTYNDMLIEIQFRTHLQHIWATAVEMMKVITGKDIKSGEGSPDVKRFFVLVSSLFALKEKQPPVENTPNHVNMLVDELKAIEDRNHFLNQLAEYKVMVATNFPKFKDKSPYVIMLLDYKKRFLEFKSFKSSQIERANIRYNRIETGKASSRTDAVLVRVSSDFNELRKAYPNYFSDIGEFVTLVKSYLE